MKEKRNRPELLTTWGAGREGGTFSPSVKRGEGQASTPFRWPVDRGGKRKEAAQAALKTKRGTRLR